MVTNDKGKDGQIVERQHSLGVSGKESSPNPPGRNSGRAEIKAIVNEEVLIYFMDPDEESVLTRNNAPTYSRWYLRSWSRGDSPTATRIAPENIGTANTLTTTEESRTVGPLDTDTDRAQIGIIASVSQPSLQDVAGDAAGQTGVANSTGLPTPIAYVANMTPPEHERFDQERSGGVKHAVTSDGEPAKSTTSGSYSWFGWWHNSQLNEMPHVASKSQNSGEDEAQCSPEVLSAATSDALLLAEPPVCPNQDTSTVNEQSGTVTIEAGEQIQLNITPTAGTSSWFAWWTAPKADPLNSVSTPRVRVEPDGDIKKIKSEDSPTPELSITATSSLDSNSIQPKAGPTTGPITGPTTGPITPEVNAAAFAKPPSIENASTRGSWIFWYGSRESAAAAGKSKESNGGDAGTLETADPPQLKIQVSSVDKVPLAKRNPPSVTDSSLDKSATSSGDEINKKAKGNKKDKTMAVEEATPTVPIASVIPTHSLAKQRLEKACPPNHVLPSFESCFERMESPSALCQLAKIFKPAKPTIKKHLLITQRPLKIRKAVAIGVHGFFPMRIVRTVLGEPTGTSIRFAEAAACAIKRWAAFNKLDVEVEKVALEGEGKVADRVEMLWKLLENWMDHVKNADFVLLAAHSQGVVVGIELLARMIEEGCVDKARVGFIAMAGINCGPFYHLPTSILIGSAKELFEFQKPESAVSKKYIQSLRVVLAHHVRILYIGSIDDQLVPLESSTFSNIHHPYIFRAVFVDGRVNASDFLSHLIGFALKLRNLGISDHGLIRELSPPLAGSLYAGEGHSSVYNDGTVYDLGVRHALETTDCPDVPLRVEPFELPTSNNNPYLLPWSMRGLLEEPYVRSRLQAEVNDLLSLFEKWQPASKTLRDVKFRLEGIRSKL